MIGAWKMTDIKTAAEVCKSQRIPENSVRWKACEAFVEQCNQQVTAGKSTFTLKTTKGAYPEQKSAAACYLSARLAAIQDHLPVGFKPAEQPSQPATKDDNPVKPSGKRERRIPVAEANKILATMNRDTFDVDHKLFSETEIVDVNGDGFVDPGVDKLVWGKKKVNVDKMFSYSIMQRAIGRYCMWDNPNGFKFDMTERAKQVVRKMTKQELPSVKGADKRYRADFVQYDRSSGQTCEVIHFNEPGKPMYAMGSCDNFINEDNHECYRVVENPKVDFVDGMLEFFYKYEGDESTTFEVPVNP